MASMKDIANVCGVSIATVSKALNDHSDIGTETKERIRRAAKDLGYLPNALARALKTNRTFNLGVLFVDEAMSGLTHDYFAEVLDSFKRQAEQYGYDITFINTCTEGRNNLSILEHCKYRGFDGVVIACVDFSAEQVIELIQSDLPVVTIDHIFHNRTAIVSDNISGMRELVRYVYRQGHRKIAFIHGADSSVTKNRLSSFFRTVEELGIDIPDEYILEAAYRDTSAAGAATKQLLSLAEPPTCIFYPDDFASFGGMNVIRENGLRIPEDISIVGYDGIRLGQHLEPRLTTLHQDCKEIGKQAAQKLIEMIEKPKTALAEQIVVTGTIIEGRTVQKLDQ